MTSPAQTGAVRLADADVERIAEQVAALLAPQVAGLVDADGGHQWTTVGTSRIVDARTLAQHLGVSRYCVYTHSRELGGKRIGSGPRAALRFDLDQALANATSFSTRGATGLQLFAGARFPRGTLSGFSGMVGNGERAESAQDDARGGPADGPSRPPRPLTSFVGRARELANVEALLAQHRLLTLTGPGGAGKTRLAVEVARRLADRFDGGSFLIELAPLDDPELVLGAVAAVLHIQEQGGRWTVEGLRTALAGRHILLVLDNCEHLLEAAGDLVETVLAGSDDVRLLATSREPLGVVGEARYPLPPLNVPPAGDTELTADTYGAVALFEQRARQADPQFAVDTDSAGPIGEIVRRLDGMPLAIELAAAQVDVLGLDGLLDGLARPLEVLVSESERVEGRQSSLQAAIDWSYRMLSAPEQAVFRALSVFAGPFTLEAAAAVSSAEATRIVPRLVRRSLLVAPTPGEDGSSRYRMLATLRAHANDELERDGEQAACLSRLAGWALTSALARAGAFRDIAHLLPGVATGKDETATVQWMDAERDNLRAALESMLDCDPPGAVALALCLAPWWSLRGRNTEGVPMLERVLTASPDTPREARAAVEIWLGRAGWHSGRDGQTAHFQRARELAGAGPSALVVDALSHEGRVILWQLEGETDMAIDKITRALEMARSIGYVSGEVLASTQFGWAAMHAGSYTDALRWAERAHVIDASLLGREATRGRAGLLVDALEALGEPARLERAAREQIEIAAREGDSVLLAMHLDVLARLEMASGRRREAGGHIDEAARLAAVTGNHKLFEFILETAVVFLGDRDPRSSATIWGAEQAVYGQSGSRDSQPHDVAFRAPTLAKVESALGKDEMQDLERRGREMPLGAVLELLHGLLRAAAASGSDERGESYKLSKRERELLGLVADGLTDAQIAERLYISVKTVHSHLDRIRDKTGARRRPELTRVAQELAVAVADPATS